jgi:uncharacterized membrane protein YfcA
MKITKEHLITGLPAGLINGLLGSGGGSYLVFYLPRLLKLKQHCAHATSLIVILPTTLLSIIIYIFKADIPLRLLANTAIAGTLGGWIGSKLLTKVPSRWLGLALGFFLIISGGRMLYACIGHFF